jgi:serine/threonine protein kinase
MPQKSVSLGADMPSLRIGRYETIRPIASGGMATVYLGRAQGAGGFERSVAIKVMHPHLAEDPEFVTMFLDEARMAANLRHPNVVPTLDVARDGKRLFLVMEFIEGVALSHVLKAVRKRKQRLPVGIAVRIVLDALAGLGAAHALKTPDGLPMNLVHRDVSPHNVLVGVSGIARIMDFGIARAATRVTTTREGQLKGKLRYMSPEQLTGESVDQRSDLYAASIVLWETLTQKGLFRADNEGAMLALVLAGAKTAPGELRNDVPSAIDEVCMRALSLHPDGRYQAAAEFEEALEEAAKRSGVAIATPREVAAMTASLPPPKPVDLDELSDPSAALGSRSGRTNAAQVMSRPPQRRSLPVASIAAVIAASALTGIAVWFAVGPATPLPAVQAPAMEADETTAPASEAPSAEPTAEPIVSESVSAEASVAPTASASAPPVAPAPRVVVPRRPRKKTNKTFRPEEP